MEIKGIGPRGLVTKEVPLPARCSVKLIVVRELDGHDEKDVGAWMDAVISADPAIAKDALKLMQLERRESMRRSIVSVDGKEVNGDGLPFKGMDGWTKRTMNALGITYNELNGLDEAEVGKLQAACRTTTSRLTNEGSPQLSAVGSSVA